jgi:hypothetical protein
MFFPLDKARQLCEIECADRGIVFGGQQQQVSADKPEHSGVGRRFSAPRSNASAAGGACAIRKTKSSEERLLKMKNETKATKISHFTRVLALAVIAMFGVATLTPAQELVKASFTLTKDTRFGTTILPAGRYTASVEPVSGLRTVGSAVSIVVRPESGSGKMAAVLATASREGCDGGLTLQSDTAGVFAQTMCLDKQQLVLHFDLSHSGNLL